MPNKNTVNSIMDNVQTVADGQGIKFSKQAYEEEAIPASLIPFGKVFYLGIEFEYVHGQRAGYAEQRVLLSVILKERDAVKMMRDLLDWTHDLRDALTINALNIGDLVSSKLVSRVTVEEVTVDNKVDLSIMNMTILVRYREL